MSNETLISIILATVSFVWLSLLSYFFYKSRRQHQRLLQGTKDMGLEAVIERILADTEENTKTSTSLKEYIQALDSDGRLHLQHVSLVRFNPFDETGGDQSFALAMLDRNGDGVVLSSLHARELTRVYGKPVKGGRPEGYQFSEEETRAVSSALGKK